MMELKFNTEQNTIIEGIAQHMKVVGTLLMVFGGLSCLTILNGEVGGLITGALQAFLGLLTRKAAAGFQQVVTTDGNAMSSLMHAMTELRTLFQIEKWVLVVGVATTVLFFFIALFVGIGAVVS